MASEVENKDTIITDDILELVQITDFKDYLRMYKRHKLFSNHPIVQICLKLFGMLKDFAQNNVNKSTKVYLDSKFAELQLYFSDDLDNEDLVENSSELNKINAGFQEEIVSFMFICKISKNVEISVQLPTEVHRFNKVVHFPLLP